jgi:hypothetical protein
MARRFLAIAALFGVLAVACGKVGPPVRVRAESTATGSSETTEETGASAAEKSEEEEKKP